MRGNRSRKPNHAPPNLTRLTKATLADLLWHFATLDGTDTEESAWGALEHAAKEIGPMHPQDVIALRELAKIRRKKPLAYWPRVSGLTVQDTIEHRAASIGRALLRGLTPNEAFAVSEAIDLGLRRLKGGKA